VTSVPAHGHLSADEELANFRMLELLFECLVKEEDRTVHCHTE
jgi:hypothetical protein